MINRNDWNEMTEVERAEWKTLMASPEFSAMSQMEKILAENKTAAAAHKRNWERGPNAEQIADNERNNRAAKRMVANDAAAVMCGCGKPNSTCGGNSPYCN